MRRQILLKVMWWGVITVVVTTLQSLTVAAETTLEKVRQQGYIRVGFANEAPFGYATPAGKLTGEAPEVAKAVLTRMGIA